MIVLLSILAIYLASLAFLRVRNRAHLPWGRQLTDFSTFMVPFNLPAYWLSKVPTSPFLDQRHYPELNVLAGGARRRCSLRR